MSIIGLCCCSPSAGCNQFVCPSEWVEGEMIYSTVVYGGGWSERTTHECPCCCDEEDCPPCGNCAGRVSSTDSSSEFTRYVSVRFKFRAEISYTEGGYGYEFSTGWTSFTDPIETGQVSDVGVIVEGFFEGDVSSLSHFDTDSTHSPCPDDQDECLSTFSSRSETGEHYPRYPVTEDNVEFTLGIGGWSITGREVTFSKDEWPSGETCIPEQCYFQTTVRGIKVLASAVNETVISQTVLEHSHLDPCRMVSDDLDCSREEDVYDNVSFTTFGAIGDDPDEAITHCEEAPGPTEYGKLGTLTSDINNVNPHLIAATCGPGTPPGPITSRHYVGMPPETSCVARWTRNMAPNEMRYRTATIDNPTDGDSEKCSDDCSPIGTWTQEGSFSETTQGVYACIRNITPTDWRPPPP